MKSQTLLYGLLFILLAWCIGCKNAPITPSIEFGPEWIVYTTGNSAIVNNSINAITIDGSQNVWFATDDGASRFNGTSWQNFHDQLGFTGPFGPSHKVNAVASAKDASIWFGLAGGGLRRYAPFSEGSVWTSYGTPAISSNMIFGIACDYVNNIWVGTDLGASRFVPSGTTPSEGVWVNYGSRNSPIPDEAVRCVGINLNNNSIWFGTYSQGAVSFDGDVNWDITAPNNAPLPILSMTFTPQNIGWFGTYADWAYRYTVATTEWLQVADSAHGGGLPDNFVNAVASGGGKVWFGTNRGLSTFDGGIWKVLNTANSMIPSDTVRALRLDSKGNLWIGTPNGAAEYREGGTVK